MHRFYCPDMSLPGFTAADTAGGGNSPVDLTPGKSDPAAILPDPLVELNDSESHHAIKVLRKRTGDAVELLDGRGTLANGVIEREKPTVLVKVAHWDTQPQAKPLIRVAASLPKGPRTDEMVNQLVQLGVHELIPLQTVRATVKARDNKLERMERITVSAMKQSGRRYLMKVSQPEPLEGVLACPAALRLIADPTAKPINGLLNRLQNADDVMLLIGPEGGFTDQESQAAKDAGCLPWQVGDNIMRIETAAVACTAVLYYLAHSNKSI